MAVTLLNQPNPKRPQEGPEALISFDACLPSKNNKLNGQEIEKILDEIDYPGSAVEKIVSLNLQNVPKQAKHTIPKIVITPNYEDEENKAPNFIVPIVKSKQNNSDSDMMKFYTSSIKSHVDESSYEEHTISQNNRSLMFDNNQIPLMDNESYSSNNFKIPEISKLLNSSSIIDLPAFSLINDSKQSSQSSEKIINSDEYCNPALSELLNNQNSQIGQENIPNISALQNSKSKNCKDSYSSISDIPKLSVLYVTTQENNQNPNSVLTNSLDYTPNFSILNKSTSIILEPNDSSSIYVQKINRNEDFSSSISNNPNKKANEVVPYSENKITNKMSSSLETFLPDFSVMQSLTTRSKTLSSSDSNSRPCNSPLPQLSLNTRLPHFNYNDLTIATNNFNGDLYVTESENGRFLGSGAFGSVFLAFGLFDKPVAVKKLVLEDVDNVDVDATVTKQFKNEVEVLSHYQHPNLLELVGYSCDGCTYCLMYEYIQGGALNVRLQVSS